jgi:hypothetical protein
MMSSNVVAVARTIGAIRDAGRATPADEAQIAAAELLAAAVDADPLNASLWREYRAALIQLSQIGATIGDDDDLDELLASFRGATPVVNPPN